MKHVSDRILLRLRWLFILFGVHFIVGYGVVVGLLHGSIQGNTSYSYQVAIVAGVQLLYEVVAQVWLYRKWGTWRAGIGSFVAVFLVATMAIEYNGVYVSPFAPSIFILTFIAGAFAQYLSPGVAFIYLIGFMLSLAKVFTTKDGGPVAGGIFLAIECVGCYLSYAVWRRHYNVDSTPEMERLGRNLRTSQDQAAIVLRSITDGVVTINEQGVIQLFNDAAGTITGWSMEEASGLDWRLVFKFVDNKGQALEDASTALAKAIRKTQNVRDNTANLLTKSEKTIAVNFSATPLRDASDRIVGVIGIFRDVSQERQQETQRAEFISTASHEMRTPVAAIEGYLSLALNEKVASIDPKARDYLEKAHANTQHLGQLFQDLLTSAKAEDGRLTNNPRIVELGAYLEQLTQDLKFSAEKKGLFVDFAMGAANTQIIDTTQKMVKPLYYARVDPDRLREVITNVYDNAVKYTDKGKINIGLTGNDKVIQFYIKDTGPGIPPEDIPHLFQKFYRVDNSATRTIGGTGLGLFICRKIIELYSGRIWAESELGKGTTFYVNLPRIDTNKAEELLAAEKQTSQPTM